MIIGISGKIGSGKDTVGSIIQYLTSHVAHKSFEDWEERQSPDYFPKELNITWEIKKYADKLKDIVCLLIGCTREQLEDHKFKNTPLGEEWQHYFLDNVLTDLTPRKILQLLGTECGREIIHPNCWVNALFVDYKNPHTRPWTSEEKRKDKNLHGGVVSYSDRLEKSYPNWIVTDVRFPNEANAILEKEGILIRLTRTINQDQHSSETALDNYEKFTNVIINGDGDLRHVYVMTKKILKEHRII